MLERHPKDTLKAAGEARDFTIRNIPAGQWRNIHDELELLVGKERASVEYGTGKPYSERAEDSFLRAHYDCFPDRDPRWPKERPRPQFYLWDLTPGPTEDIRAQFVGIANRIGKLLGCPQGTEPLDFTLYRLLTSLQKHKSSYLKFPDEDSGIILHVCEALMVFCSWHGAELEAAEPTAAPQPGDIPNDVQRQLAASGEFLCRAEEDLRLEEDRLTKSSAERTEWENKGDKYLARVYKDSEKNRRRLDKELEEGSIQRREFQAKVHKISMAAISRLESQVTERPQVREETRTARLVEQENTRKPRNVHHNLLKALIGITKRKYPGISHRDLCMRLDTMTKPVNLPPGSTWQKKSAETSWIGNYDCDAVRPLMDTYFSKIPSASPKRKSTK